MARCFEGTVSSTPWTRRAKPRTTVAATVNTWAAYQCYGDPDWVFQRKAPDANQATAPSVEDFSGVASVVSLRFALERIVVQTKFQGADLATAAQQPEKAGGAVRRETAMGEDRRGGRAVWRGVCRGRRLRSGIQWYEKAVAAPDGKASMKAAEQLSNVRGRLGWEIVDKAVRHLDDMKTREKAGGQTSKARAAARRARVDAERSLRQAVDRADDLIGQSLALLAKLIAVKQTLERASLIGSAYKRRALVDGAAGRRARIHRDLQQMKAGYQDAQDVGETERCLRPLLSRLELSRR